MLAFVTRLPHACETWRKRPAAIARVAGCLVVCLGVLVFAGSGEARAQAGAAAPAATPAATEPAPAQPAAAPDSHAAPEAAAPHAEAAPHGAEAGGAHEGSEEEHSSPWGFIGKIVNFAILAGALVYFLRAPISKYLADRGVQIRGDLTTAARMTAEAKAQVAALEEKLKQLPNEIAALRARGQEEVAAEEARIRADAQSDRDRILDETKREIDLQLRLAHRELVTHAADLSIQIARGRVAERITSDDQLRLVDRYLQQVKKA